MFKERKREGDKGTKGRKKRKREGKNKGRKETIKIELTVLRFFYVFVWNYFKWENEKKKLVVTKLYRDRVVDDKEIKMK